MRELDLAYRTMFAELGQRCMDARFQTDFPVEGRFVTVPAKGNSYWYFDLRGDDGKIKRSYVGPQSDTDITQRVEAFREIKDDLRGRRKLVSTLTREAGLQAPERFTGDVVEALSEAGLFRLRGVLVGTVAFQCYAGLLGVKLPSAAMQTGDADFAQFHSVSAAIGDTLPPVLDVIRQIDPSFREIPSQADSRKSTQFENRSRFKVEFLTPNTGSDEYGGRPASMPALGGASAQPLRFLDFLIYEPVRSVMLHRNGVPVVVPAPERYAVHKLIVASRRRTDEGGSLKREKDVRQAELLMQALIETRQQSDLADVFMQAWDRGPSWQEGIARGMSYMSAKSRDVIEEALREGIADLSRDPAKYGLDTASLPTP